MELGEKPHDYGHFWRDGRSGGNRPVSAAGHPAPAVGLLENTTLLAVYGRGFAIAPILGHLGTYSDIRAMATDTAMWVPKIKRVNGGKGVVIAIDLIYGMAIPYKGAANCLEYLDQSDSDPADKYMKPATKRGWAVILETQLGRSDPVAEVKRMMASRLRKK